MYKRLLPILLASSCGSLVPALGCSTTPPPRDVLAAADDACQAYLDSERGRELVAAYASEHGVPVDEAAEQLCAAVQSDFADAILRTKRAAAGLQ
jgi:hypothetical protein